jgi:putative membrane protein
MHRTLICSFLLIGGLAMAQDPAKTKDRSTAETAGETNRMQNMSNDRTFVMNAAIGGMAEVEMGKLAAEKATDPRVKQFGQKMVDDHSKANDDLKTVATQRAYVKEMVKDHDEDVKEFHKQSQNGQDSAVRDFASKTLPTLQEHQRMILDINKGGMKSSSADRSKQ